MRRWMIAILGSAFATAAHAATFSWRYDGDLYQSARTPAQYRLLVRLYPTLFDEQDAEEVESASVTVGLWTLTGDTRCAESDSRAHVRTIAKLVCVYEAKQAPQCTGSSSPLPPSTPTVDPCAND